MTLAYPMEPHPGKARLLDKINAEYLLDTVLIKDINIEGRLQIRPDDAVPPDDWVKRYALDMKDGDAFPPIILYTPNGTAKYGLAGGTNRLESAKRIGATRIPAYVMLEPTERQILRARVLDNKEGRPTSVDEQVKLANRLIDEHGVSMRAAAEDVGISENALVHRRKRDQAIVRAYEAGLTQREVTETSDSALMAVNTIHAPEVRRLAFKLVGDKRYNARRTSELVKAIRSEPTEAQQLERIKGEIHAVYDEEPGRDIAELRQFHMHLGALQKLDFATVLRQANTDLAPLMVRVDEAGLLLAGWKRLLELGT